MFDLLSIGTISIDLYFRSESLTLQSGRFHLALGGKYDADHFYESLGGGGANIAIGVQKHGLKAAVVGKIGNNQFKKIILDNLEENGVFYKYSKFEDNYYNISSILLAPNGERTVIHHQTAHIHSFDHMKDFDNIQKTKAVFIGNIPDSRLRIKEKLIFFFRKRNIPIFLNLGITDCRRSKHHIADLVRYVDVLIINGHEFAEMVKAPYQDIDFSEHVIRYYIPQLKDKLVIVTEGHKGSYGYLHDIVHHQPAIKPDNILDTTGAGDGYTAAFIATYIQSNDLRKSMLAGAKYAVKILAKIGAN